MRFEMFQSQQDRQFYFELVDDNGQTLLSSGGFPDQESCTNAIRDLIQALPLENRYSVQSIAGGAQLSILNAAGTALATSPVLAGTAAAAAARDAYLADAADNREYEVRVTTYTRKTVQLSDDYAFLSDIDFSKFYDFTRASTSGRAGFEPFQAGNEQYYFHFNDADGKAILFSRDFPTPFQRDKRIRSIIKAAGKSERYEIIEADGTFFFILKASNHQEIARSRNFGSREAAEAAIAYCQANIPPYKSEYPEPEKKKSRKGVNEYNLDLRPDSSDAGFATLRNADDKGHYFFFLNASGQPILFSQSYSGARGRDNGIRAVIRNAGTADRYERHQEDGVYYFVLRAANRQEIARSADFESEADMEAAIRYLTLQAPTYAGAYEVTLETEETSSFTLDFVAPPAPAPEPVVADRREDNYLTCKLYHGHPRSETYPDFSTFEHNGEYYFAMLDEDGEVVFRSEGYTSVSARDNGIQSVMKNREIEERYSIEERMGAHFLVLKAGNHQEIARSCAKGDESGARYYLPSVWTARREAALAALAAAAAPAVTAPVADRREDNYLACRMYSGHPRSEAYPDFSTFEHNGEYYFAMLDKDGEVVLRSEGYTSTAARDNGIQSVLKNREIEERFSVEEKMNRYFLVLKAGNHQEIARSCAKEEEAGAWAWWTGWKSAVAAAAALSAVAAIPDPEPTPVVETEPVAVSKDKEDDYLACKEYQGKHVNDKRNNVALFKHSNGQYYFAVYHKDGKVRLRSEGFKTAKDRDVELSGVLKNIDNKELYERIERGDYYIEVLRDKTGREVGRSCLKKIAAAAPVVAAPVAAAATVVAAAAAAVPKPEPVKKVVTPAPVPAAAPVVQSSGGGMPWLWWLLPLLLLAALLFWWKGCSKTEEMAIATPPPVETPPPVATPEPEPAPVVETPPPAAVSCNCNSQTHPVFKLPANTGTPKSLTVLGRAPEFGDSHGLDGAGFYNKLKGRYEASSTDKRFLDGIFRAMGYENGFADATAGLFSEATLTPGTIGNIGTGKNHRTVYRKLDTQGRDLLAFKIKAANGCDLHFMKTCGNHFFFCPNN